MVEFHTNGNQMNKDHRIVIASDSGIHKSCHNRKEQNLQGKVPLSHLHLWNGISCRNCHGEAISDQALTTAQCLSCHKSYPEVAKLTKGSAPNPHESHSGNVECGLCHRAHRKSESYCNKCHNFFDFRVP